MDLKYKGISWVGNIYQKFETVCNEVDNVVSQTTVKYVEDQVQSVGKGMRNFYSNVINDLLPPSMEPVNYEEQGVKIKGNATSHTYVQCKLGDEENSSKTSLLHFEPIEVSAMNKKLDYALSELRLVEQPNAMTSMNDFEDMEMESVAGEIREVIINKNADVIVDEISMKEKPSVVEVSDLISICEELSYGKAFLSESFDSNDKILYQNVPEDSPATLVPGLGHQSHRKVVVVSSSCADNSECGSDALWAHNSSGTTPLNAFYIAEEKNNTSSHSVSHESYLPEDSHGNSLANAAFHPAPFDEATSVSHCTISSSTLIPTISAENKVPQKILSPPNSVLLPEAIGEYVSKIENGVGSLIETPRSKTPQHHESAYEMLVALPDIESVGPSDATGDDINDSFMETIELHDNVNLEDNCIYIDTAALLAASHTTKRNRSYKKMIQDALTSRKRLVKEYEQLAIWFGDFDLGSEQESSQTLYPYTTIRTPESENLETDLLSDSEWELL